MPPVLKAELIPLVIIAVVLFLMIKFSGLKIWHAAVVLAIGIYLASGPIGTQITTWTDEVLKAFGH